MAPISVAVLKFVGSVSLGLLTGLSYTLSTITIPALLTLPSASSASLTFSHLTSRAVSDLRIWTGVSTSSFLLAYILSPRGSRQPYLLWTSLCVVGSTAVDMVLNPQTAEATTSPRRRSNRDRKGKGKMEASYEVLGDSHSEETGSNSDEGDDDINGEGVRTAMEGFWLNQSARFVIAGAGFVMSIVGIWGDGA